MLRIIALLSGTVFAVVSIAIGSASPALAEPVGGDCIAGKMNLDGSCYYKNCSEAKAAGECDIPQDSDHYCSKQDADDDGLACEC